MEYLFDNNYYYDELKIWHFLIVIFKFDPKRRWGDNQSGEGPYDDSEVIN